MENIKHQYSCSKCNKEIDGTNIISCPFCDSKELNVLVSAKETITLKKCTKVKLKDPSLSTKNKLRFEMREGCDKSKMTSTGYVNKIRIVDKTNNHYFEKIEDENGSLLHPVCDEPLDKHFGHGYAKFKNK